VLKQKDNPWPMMAKQTPSTEVTTTGKYNFGDKPRELITGVPGRVAP
jgi:hypothetical protein